MTMFPNPRNHRACQRSLLDQHLYTSMTRLSRRIDQEQIQGIQKVQTLSIPFSWFESRVGVLELKKGGGTNRTFFVEPNWNRASIAYTCESILKCTTYM